MAFMGMVPGKSVVSIELGNDFSAQGVAFLLATYAPNSGAPVTEGVRVSPGTSADVEIRTKATGFMRIFVDFREADDSGSLTVRVNGKVQDKEPILGDTTWAYGVE